MKIELYKSVIDNLAVGCALNKILFNENGKGNDYEFIHINRDFERLTGLDRNSIIGKKVSDLTEKYSQSHFNWEKIYRDESLNSEKKYFQEYIEHLNRWLKINISLLDDGNLITVVTDITEEIRDIEEKQFLLTLTQDIVFELDEQYVFRNIITADESLLFMPRQAILGKNINQLFPQELAQSFIDVYKRAEVTGQKEKMIYQSSTGDKWYESIVIFHKTKSSIGKFIVSIHDITEQKQMEDDLKRKTEELEKFFRISPDLMCIIDFDGNFINVNNAWENLLGISKEELKKRRMYEFMHPDDREESVCEISKLHENREVNFFTNRYLSKDGSYRFIEWCSQSDGPLIYCGARDITERKESADKIRYLSFNDQLTGLYNRRFFEEEQQRLDVSSNLPISVIMGDLNALKLANDTFGHFVGDELLKRTAKVLKDKCRNNDIICRIGGDEFAILLPNTDQSVAKIVVDRITKAAEEESVELIDLSISFGWSTKENEKQDMSETLKRAEELMYERKAVMLDENRIRSVDKLLKGLFEKSPIEEEHAKKVSKYSELIGKELGFSPFRLNMLKNAAFLHDIGKVTIEESSLNKAGRLNELEQNKMKHHPEVGYRILSYGSPTVEIARYVLYHHERWDGLGYPHGLKGEDIPIQSRIIAVAEGYEAMTSDRSYLKGLSETAAIEELKRHAGTQFDPKIVDVFVDILTGSIV